MATTKKILIVLTTHAAIGDTERKTGVWFEELATPYYAFIDGGIAVDLASIAGGEVPVDPHSMEGERPPSVKRFLDDATAMAKLGRFFREQGLYTLVRWNCFYTNPPLVISEDELRHGFDIIDAGLTAIAE